mmetsp:Transcript_45352/g.145941  ORF Transcript_45352/g.145941 Transcript_45352/m.145941 type:complete len:448 (-) Transcript_45352:126-1469(-)
MEAVALPAFRSDVSPNMSPAVRCPTTTAAGCPLSESSTRSSPARIWKRAAVGCPSSSTLSPCRNRRCFAPARNKSQSAGESSMSLSSDPSCCALLPCANALAISSSTSSNPPPSIAGRWSCTLRAFVLRRHPSIACQHPSKLSGMVSSYEHPFACTSSVFAVSDERSSASTSPNGIVCCLWKPNTFQSKHRNESKSSISPNCTLASLTAFVSLRIEQVVRSSSASSSASPKSCRYFAAVCASAAPPPAPFGGAFGFCETTSCRILALASPMRSESVVASSRKREPACAGSERSMPSSSPCSSSSAVTAPPEAMQEMEGASPSSSDISPIRSPAPRRAISLSELAFLRETAPETMKIAEEEAEPSSMSNSPSWKVLLQPSFSKSAFVVSDDNSSDPKLEVDMRSRWPLVERALPSVLADGPRLIFELDAAGPFGLLALPRSLFTTAST